MSHDSMDRQVAALEAAVAHRLEVLAEGRALPREGRPPQPPRHWAPAGPMIKLTSLVVTACTTAVVLVLVMQLPVDDWDLRNALAEQRLVEKGIAELKKELPSIRRKLASHKRLAPDPPTPDEPRIPVTGVEVSLKQLVNRTRAAKRALPRSLLAWLNVGLAGCTVGNEQVALDAARQLGLYIPVDSRGPLAPPGVGAQTMLVLLCKEVGVKLGPGVIGGYPRVGTPAMGD